MKKNIIIVSTVLLGLSLTILGCINGNDANTAMAETSNMEPVATEKQMAVNTNEKNVTPFFFSIGTRFNSFKKSELDKVRSFDDFIGEEHAGRIVSYKSLSVILLDDNKQTDTKETGTSGILSPAQLKLLQSSDYSTNLLIWADYSEKNKETGLVEENSWTPYITVVPEKQANYSWGNEALIYYLEHNSKEETAGLTEAQLESGKLYITISKEGLVSDAEVVATSGFPIVDEKVKELIFKLPGNWQPAENTNGEKVEQTLVISFGRIGC